MIFHNNKIVFIFIQIFIFIESSSSDIIYTFPHSEKKNYSNISILKKPYNMTVKCNNLTDCFNCTVVPYCRWIWTNQTCIIFKPFKRNYSIPLLNKTYFNNNLTRLNRFINFMRKVCFLPYIPYKENNNSLIYNNISTKYCGPHHITTPLSNFRQNFKIELKNISGIYGLPNILCEYIILSGPGSFDANIEINEVEAQNFYLLYSEDSRYFSSHINESQSFHIGSTGRRANTFIYYGLKSLNSSPFNITFKENKVSKDSQTTGYIMIGLIVVVFILVVTSIIYIRNNSRLFKKEKEISEEEEKMKEKTDFTSINKFEPTTPDDFMSKQNQNKFTFENSSLQKVDKTQELYICCFDNQLINNKNEAYHPRCGHIYHINCYNKLLQNSIKVGKELKCILCQEVIYP